MSESTLSLGYPDFAAEVAYYLGYTRTLANWNSDQTADIDACIQGGLRMFYNPMDVGLPKHEWRFMRPTARLSIYASQVVSNASWLAGVVTITVPVQIAVGALIVVSGLTPTGYNGTYVVTSSTATTATYALASNPGAFSVAGTVAINDYAAPDDFGGIDGDFTYDSSNNAGNTIPVFNEEIIRSKRQSYVNVTGRPVMAAIASPVTDGTTGQRYLFQFWPNVDGSYTLTYKYRALLNKISTAKPYPMGGMTHGETQKACMLAWAERHINDVMNGERWDYMVQRMRASINAERTGMVPENFGYNGDDSDNVGGIDFQLARTSNVTVNGIQN